MGVGVADADAEAEAEADEDVEADEDADEEADADAEGDAEDEDAEGDDGSPAGTSEISPNGTCASPSSACADARRHWSRLLSSGAPASYASLL